MRGMTDERSARAAMLEALEPQLGPELIRVFDELLPKKPWGTTIPAEHWHRVEVRAVVANYEAKRRDLHDALIDLIGEPHAGTLMDHLLPAPWSTLSRLGVPVADLVA